MTSYARHVTQNEFFLSHYIRLPNIFPTIYGLFGLYAAVRQRKKNKPFLSWRIPLQGRQKSVYDVIPPSRDPKRKFFYPTISASRISFRRYMVCRGYSQPFARNKKNRIQNVGIRDLRDFPDLGKWRNGCHGRNFEDIEKKMSRYMVFVYGFIWFYMVLYGFIWFLYGIYGILGKSIKIRYARHVTQK